MSEITIEAIATAMEGVLKQELAPIKATLADIQTSVHQHTAALDALAKSVQILLDDRAVTTHRIERVEKAVKDLATKAGLKLDW